jgi:hypothetical protein
MSAIEKKKKQKKRPSQQTNVGLIVAKEIDTA